jgi:hypothetical protein
MTAEVLPEPNPEPVVNRFELTIMAEAEVIKAKDQEEVE